MRGGTLRRSGSISMECPLRRLRLTARPPAQLLSSLSYQMANVGKPHDAALLTRSAVKGVGDASPLVRALLLERVAWASARSRDYSSTRRVLAAVDDVYEDRSSGVAEPDCVYWLDRREIDVMAARCLIELGSPRAAAPLLARAIDSYDINHAREVALYLSWLAEAYARAGILMRHMTCSLEFVESHEGDWLAHLVCGTLTGALCSASGDGAPGRPHRSTSNPRLAITRPVHASTAHPG